MLAFKILILKISILFGDRSYEIKILISYQNAKSLIQSFSSQSLSKEYANVIKILKYYLNCKIVSEINYYQFTYSFLSYPFINQPECHLYQKYLYCRIVIYKLYNFNQK